jgi:hypothetical protein
MGTAQSTPWSLTSAKGRSFGLSYTAMAASSTGWVWWIGFRAGLDRSQADFSIFGEAEEGWGLHDERVLAGASRTEISCVGPDHLILGQPTAVASGKAGLWTRSVQFRQAGAHRLSLKSLKFPSLKSHTCSNWFSSLFTSFPHGCP